MWAKINITMVAIVALSLLGGPVNADTAEISAVNKPADLDLSGNILYAINFGDNGNPVVGGILFSQEEECPTIRLQAEGEGPATWWGPYPGTEDAGLNQLLNGLTYRYTPPCEISIDIEGLFAGSMYHLQLITYEPENHSRTVDITVDNEQIVTGLNPIAAQGGVCGKGGMVVKYSFVLGNPVLNIRLVSRTNAIGLSGFILTMLSKPITPFADYGSGTTTELVSGKGTWRINWGQGPWTWSEMTGQALLDSNVSGILDIHTTAPADVSADLVATLPIAGTLTLSAHDKNHKDVTTGTMVLSGAGINVVDLNASRVLVDEGSGMAFAPFHAPAPRLALTLDEATGVFAYIDELRNCELYLAGSYAAPLVKGLALQSNIMAALNGKIPLIGGLGTFALSGQCVSDVSKKVKSFCEYGKGVSSQLGAAGAVWDQTWGYGPYDWYNCDADPNGGILGNDVVGLLKTITTDAPKIDEDLILRFDFGGNFALTDYTDTNHEVIAGQILGDAKGTFVADINAANAVVDEAAGTITIRFGAPVEGDPDALITITETTGTFKSVHPVGVWEWRVSGTMACARVPTLSVQDNILAALGNSDLLLGAEEEIVLSGSYYHDSSGN